MGLKGLTQKITQSFGLLDIHPPLMRKWNTGIQPKLSYFHLRSLYHSSVIFLQQANCSMALQISKKPIY